ncbi:MAG: hypothetical protein V1933_06135, partial [Candidatus Omnitrophota bacterium]
FHAELSLPVLLNIFFHLIASLYYSIRRPDYTQLLYALYCPYRKKTGPPPKNTLFLPADDFTDIIDDIFEELTILQKYRIFKNIVNIPNVGCIIDELNRIRNAIAHSSAPDYSKKYSIKFKNISIYSLKGFKLFHEEVEKIYNIFINMDHSCPN